MKILMIRIILLLFFCINFVFGQNNCTCTELENKKEKLENFILNKNILEINKTLHHYLKSSSNCSSIAYSYLIQYYLKINNTDSIDKYLTFLKNNKCNSIQMDYHYFTGYNFVKKMQYDSASSHLIKAIELSEKLKNIPAIAKSYLAFALVFDKLAQPQKAIAYYKKGIEYAKQTNDMKLILYGYTNLQSSYGLYFDETQNKSYLDSIKQLCYTTLNLSKQNNFKKEIIRSYVTLAGTFYSEKNYKVALQYCDSVILLANAHEYKAQIHSAYYKSALCYLEQLQYKKALISADSALVYADSQQKKANAYFVLYEGNKNCGNYKDALFYFEKVQLIDMEVLNADRVAAVTELEQKYEKAKNEKTIKELNQESEINTLRIRVLIFGVILSVVLIITIIAFFRQKNLKNKQLIIEAEQRLNRARINPHFFFNALTSLQGLAVKEDDGKKMALHLYKFSSLMRKTLESSYNDFVSIEKEIEFIEQYITLEKLKNFDLFDFTIFINEAINETQVKVPTMLVQPFLENAIEHGFSVIKHKGNLKLNFNKLDDKLIIEIIDNGIGLSLKNNNEKNISRALQITKDRLYLINLNNKVKSDFTIKSNSPSGVIVEIVLPLVL